MSGQKKTSPSVGWVNDEILAIGPHWRFAWLRRWELDTEEDGFCYEHPDGDLIYSKDPSHEQIMMLHCCRDATTGEKYVRLATEDPIKTEIDRLYELLKKMGGL